MRFLTTRISLVSLICLSILYADEKENTLSSDLSVKSQAIEPQSSQPAILRVEILGLDAKGDAALKQNAKNITRIGALDSKAVPDRERLDWLYETGLREIKSALEPYGYYNSGVTGSLEQVGNNWVARYNVTKGEPVKINQLIMQVVGEGHTDSSLLRILKRSRLKKDIPLNHESYEKTKDDLQDTAQSRGYFDSKFISNIVEVDLDKNIADVDLQMDTGPRYQLGVVNFKGSVFNSKFLKRFVPFEQGSPYLDESLLSLQGDLIASDYFEDVLINTERTQGEKEVPVNVDLTMRKRMHYMAGLGFSTDTGPRVRGNIEWRYINEWGHKFKVDTMFAQKKQEANIVYTIPGKLPLTDYYDIYLNLASEDTREQNYNASVIGVASIRERGSVIHKHSLEYRYDRFQSDEDRNKKLHTLLLVPTLSWSWRSQENLRFGQSGMSAYWMIRGASQHFLSDISFIQTRARAKFYFPFKRNHRLIARIEGGVTMLPKNTNFQDVPTTLRFFAGGDTSVRGYALDAIGPLEKGEITRKKRKVLGGKNLLVASLEYEYRFMNNVSFATFVDVGDAFNGSKWKPKAGIGIGGRWYSPVGAVRLDIAHGFDKKVGDNLRLHLTIGADL